MKLDLKRHWEVYQLQKIEITHLVRRLWIVKVAKCSLARL